MKLLALVVLGLIIQNTHSLCTPPFEELNGGCYFYNQGLFVDSYQFASDFCQNIGGYLSMVKRGEENRAIINTYLIGTSADAVLLGARRNELTLFEWIDGTLVRDGFTGWAESQPDGSGDCLGFTPGPDLNYGWDDFSCLNYTVAELNIGFLCEENIGDMTMAPTTTTTPAPTKTTTPAPTTTATPAPTTTTTPAPTTTTTPAPTTTTPRECAPPFVDLGTGCYLYISNSAPYEQARQDCINRGAHLVYITSADEQAAIEPYVAANNNGAFMYIGGYDLYLNDTMYWLDGTPADSTYTNFNEIAVNGGSENAFYMDDDINWQWGDTLDTANQPYLCEQNFDN